MESILNIDLLWVGIAVAGAGTLGCSIYFSDTKSSTSKAFLLFTTVSVCWSIANFVSARATTPISILWSIRLVLFFATWHAFSFFVLANQLPTRDPVLSKKKVLILFSWATVVAIVVLTPTVFEAVTAVSPAVETKTGPGIVLFGLTVFSFVGAGIHSLFRKLRNSTGTERNQMEFIFYGMTITFVGLVTFDFIFPAFLNISTLVPFGGLFLLPFIFGTAYAILKYELFNVRVAIFGLLTFLLATATFFDVLLSNTIGLVFYRIGELILVLFAGILLIRNMVREFELEQELKETNLRQEGLIRFISHEVKNFLAKDRGAFASLIEGDFGKLSDELVPFVQRALAQSTDAVNSVMDILKASNQKKGTVEYKKESFDLKVLLESVFEKLKLNAEKKKLGFACVIDSGLYPMVGDRAEIGDHVLLNLIENSINYTPTGAVQVVLKKENNKYIFTVKDTGVGITEEDKKRLFTEGGHGKDSQRINVHSTGYGLFIAKSIVEAHKGTVRAESEGAGKGSTFIVEFPI